MVGEVFQEGASVRYLQAERFEARSKWTPALGDGGCRFLETFENWQPLDNCGNAKWILQQWVEMFLMKCASQIWEARKKGRQGNKRLGMDLGKRACTKVRSNLPELPNTTFMVVICCVSNGKDTILASKQLQASYTDVRHWEEMIDFIDKNEGLKEPYIITSMFKCTFKQDVLDEEYMGLYSNGTW